MLATLKPILLAPRANPTGLTLVGGVGWILVSWNPASGAQGYDLQSSPDNSTWTTLVSNQAGTSYQDTGAATTAATSTGLVYYRVRTTGNPNYTSSVSASPWLIYDQFTAADNTLVTALTPIINTPGHSYTNPSLTGANGKSLITTNKLAWSGSGGTGGNFLWCIDSGQTDVTVVIDLRGGGDNMVVVRYQDTSNYYLVGLFIDNGTIEIHQILAGSKTIVATANVSITAATMYTSTIQCAGANISLSVPGLSAAISATITGAYTSALTSTVHGGWSFFNTGTFDNFKLSRLSSVPSTATTLNLSLQPGLGVFQDTGGTTPATADADVLKLWKDQTANAFDFSQATTATAFKYHPSRGMVDCEIPSGDNPPNVTSEYMSNSSVTWDRQNSSIFMILEPMSTRQPYDGSLLHNTSIPLNATGLQLKWVGVSTGANAKNPGKLAINDGTNTYYSDLYVPTSRCLIGAIMTPYGVQLVVNERSQIVPALLSGSSSGGAQLCPSSGATPYNGSYISVAGYSGAANSTLLSNIRTAAASAGVISTNTSVLGIDGDSITQGVNSTLCKCWPQQLSLSSGPLMYNVAEVGMLQTTLTTQAAARVDTLLQGGGLNVLVIFAGTNDLANGVSAATAYTNLKTYCAARKAAGWNKVVVVTCLPQGNISPDSIRTTFNTSIRGGDVSYDYIADAGGDATIGVFAAIANRTYYGGDSVHPLTAAYAIVAGYVKTQLASAGIS